MEDHNEERWRRNSARYICRAIGCPRVLIADVEADIALFRLEGSGRAYSRKKAWIKSLAFISNEWRYTQGDMYWVVDRTTDSATSLEYDSRDLLRGLSPVQQQVVLMRIAGHTLDEVGKELCVSRARAWQIEQTAYQRLRRHFQ
jgi:hypothetical protein